jgi:spore cortex formation protein SpoVR/YcgB (stage V sporulation)
MVLPIITLATISCMNRKGTSLFDENPIINQEAIEIALMHTKVVFLPNLSKKYPEIKPPIGLDMAVIEANHEACAIVSLTSVLCSLNSGSVAAG